MVPDVKTILFATDMGKHMRQVFLYAFNLAQCYEAKMIMLHVQDPFNPQSHIELDALQLSQQGEPMQDDSSGNSQEALRAQLVKFYEDHIGKPAEDCDLLEDIQVVSGQPAEMIVKEAGERGADLIVLGTNTDTSLGTQIPGSTARTLKQSSEIPVLLFPVYEI